MEIPYQKLAPDTLRAVIEEYVTRESTDYGDIEFSFDEKIAAVQLQLENGRARFQLLSLFILIETYPTRFANGYLRSHKKLWDSKFNYSTGIWSTRRDKAVLI